MLARASAGTARVTVIDWGLVKRMGETDLPTNRLTKMRRELGTPDYIAPEQARDAASVDIRADIYSLGVTLYFLLAGKPPFHARNNEQKQVAHAREEFPSLEQLRPDVPPNVLNVLKKMVKKERAQRHATPGEVAAALQPFCGAEPNRLVALLAPVSFEKPAATETARIYDEKTQLAPPPTEPMAAQPSSHRLIVWGVAAASVFILLSSCILIAVIGVGLVWNKKDDSKGDDPIAKGKSQKDAKEDGTKEKAKDPPQLNLPQVLIDEDFRAALEKKRTLPVGWKSDDFRVVNDNGEPSLEVSSPTGTYFIELPPVTLRGNFYIEGVYFLDAYHPLSIRLDARKTNTVLPIGITYYDSAP